MSSPVLNTPDGLALALSEWPVPAPRGLVVVVHGLGEHAARYDHVARALNAAGWSVLAHDQRGHGRSGGPRGTLPRGDGLLEDLAHVLDRAPATSGPRVLLGHSMGGAVAARFVAEALAPRPAAWSRPVQGLALSSPALAARLSAWQRWQLAIGERLLPNVAQRNGIDPRGLSHDEAVVAAYVADPLVHDRISARLARFILDAGEHVRAAAPRWALPTLLMWGGADRVVDPAGSRALAAAAPPDVLTAWQFEAMRHEIFNETEREGVLMRLVQWLDRL
ncbi:MAG: lysophospholipase [Burkholderiaceae bacterium]|nr:alpha/beta hydrolase [Burkholderiaceae bacterium]MCZ8175653.1 lysophospholipase [Burkholderiaceae bacterium]